MKTRAISCPSFRFSTKRAAGVEPILAPPLTLDTFTPDLIEGFDFLYLKLHGLPTQPYWYGEGFVTAISADQIAAADLSRTVVFVPACHLVELLQPHDLIDTHASPMFAALIQAHTKAIIGGAGPNYAGRRRLYGADVLGYLIRRLLELGFQPATAMSIARAKLKFARQDRITRDTLDFYLFEA